MIAAKGDHRTLTYRQEIDAEVKARIAQDLAEHTVETAYSNGYNRRWKCARPNTRSLWFEVITWPGVLCINGDMGTFVFSRTADMLSFMRSSCMSYSYVAEKCVAVEWHLGIREFRQEIFCELINELAEEADTPGLAARYRELKEEACRHADGNGHETYRRMWESGLFGSDLPTCTSYTYHFLWCLHAIKWLCDRVKDMESPREGGST